MDNTSTIPKCSPQLHGLRWEILTAAFQSMGKKKVGGKKKEEKGRRA
jgi:hypothetical protein